MNTNLSTTQDQSARLLKCGVSADTADMMLTPHNALSTEPYKETKALKKGISTKGIRLRYITKAQYDHHPL